MIFFPPIILGNPSSALRSFCFQYGTPETPGVPKIIFFANCFVAFEVPSLPTSPTGALARNRLLKECESPASWSLSGQLLRKEHTPQRSPWGAGSLDGTLPEIGNCILPRPLHLPCPAASSPQLPSSSMSLSNPWYMKSSSYNLLLGTQPKIAPPPQM